MKKAELASAQAVVLQKKSNRENAYRRFKRAEFLVSKKATSEQTFDNDKALFLAADAELVAANAAVAQSEAAIKAAEADVKRIEEDYWQLTSDNWVKAAALRLKLLCSG